MKLSYVARKMLLVICISALAFIIASIVYYRSFSFLPFAFGTLLGVALSILKVIMLEHNVDKIVGMEQQNAKNYIGLQYLLRFLLTGLVLALAAISSFINLWGAVAGIFTLQIAAYSTKFFNVDENVNE